MPPSNYPLHRSQRLTGHSLPGLAGGTPEVLCPPNRVVLLPSVLSEFFLPPSTARPICIGSFCFGYSRNPLLIPFSISD